MVTAGGPMACLRRSPPPAQCAASMRIMTSLSSTPAATGEVADQYIQIYRLLASWHLRGFAHQHFFLSLLDVSCTPSHTLRIQSLFSMIGELFRASCYTLSFMCSQMDIQPSSADKGQRGTQWWGSRWGRGRDFPVPGGRPGPDLLWHRPHQAAAERPWRVGRSHVACKSSQHTNTSQSVHFSFTPRWYFHFDLLTCGSNRNTSEMILTFCWWIPLNLCWPGLGSPHLHARGKCFGVLCWCQICALLLFYIFKII